jgi:hypothetical protein
MIIRNKDLLGSECDDGCLVNYKAPNGAEGLNTYENGNYVWRWHFDGPCDTIVSWGEAPTYWDPDPPNDEEWDCPHARKVVAEQEKEVGRRM